MLCPARSKVDAYTAHVGRKWSWSDCESVHRGKQWQSSLMEPHGNPQQRRWLSAQLRFYLGLLIYIYIYIYIEIGFSFCRMSGECRVSRRRQLSLVYASVAFWQRVVSLRPPSFTHSRQPLQTGDVLKIKCLRGVAGPLDAGWRFVRHSLQNLVYSVVLDDHCKEKRSRE